MVCLASCDKTSPGQLMAAARLNIPTIVVVCGYQQSGEYNGQHVDIEEGNPVVFIGPNNSGKTTALQAIALWEVGLRRSTINRKDLFAVPVPNTNLLWKDLQVQDVRIEIVVEGVTGDRPWTYGLGFEYANEESLYCRSLENTAALPEASRLGSCSSRRCRPWRTVSSSCSRERSVY